MGNFKNVEVFRDTERLCSQDERLQESIKASVDGQKLILEGDELGAGHGTVPGDGHVDGLGDGHGDVPGDGHGDMSGDFDLARFDSEAQVIVSRKRTFEAASAYKGKKVAVLNFASASNPGGGVVKGASAQEEGLCRCSTLYFALNVQEMWDGFYKPHRRAHDPIHNDDIIYTPGVTVFKSDTRDPQLMDESDWYSVDVITCAAPNLRNEPSNRYNPEDGEPVRVSDDELRRIHEKRLRRILDVAALGGCEVIILGAFGCGAFRNNPSVVAEAARNVIPDYSHAFENIEYAVFCRGDDTRNYDTFYEKLM